MSLTPKHLLGTLYKQGFFFHQTHYHTKIVFGIKANLSKEKVDESHATKSEAGVWSCGDTLSKAFTNDFSIQTFSDSLLGFEGFDWELFQLTCLTRLNIMIDQPDR